MTACPGSSEETKMRAGTLGPLKIKALLFAKGGGRAPVAGHLVRACERGPRCSAPPSGKPCPLHPRQKDRGTATTYGTCPVPQPPRWDSADTISSPRHSSFIREKFSKQLPGITVGNGDSGITEMVKLTKAPLPPRVCCVCRGAQTLFKRTNK